MVVQHAAQHLYFDRHWQQPARTEQCVNQNILELDLSGAPCIYVGFPWATYLDFIRKKLPDAPICAELHGALQQIKKRLSIKIDSGRYRIVTACQHIHAYAHPRLFESVGITDLFWSHKPTNRSRLGNIRLHPLPLFSVIHQQP